MIDYSRAQIGTHHLEHAPTRPSSFLAFADQGPRRQRPTGQNGNGQGPDGDKKGQPQLPPNRGLFGIIFCAAVCVLLFMMFNSPGRGERICRGWGR